MKCFTIPLWSVRFVSVCSRRIGNLYKPWSSINIPTKSQNFGIGWIFFFTKCTFTFLKKNNTEKLTAYRKPGLYCINNKFCLYWSRHSRLWYYKRISTSCFIFIEIKTILRSKNINDYEALFKMFLSKTWRGLSPRYGGCGCRTD